MDVYIKQNQASNNKKHYEEKQNREAVWLARESFLRSYLNFLNEVKRWDTELSPEKVF